MSLADENKMLYILHKNGVSRKHIKWIMNDLKESNTFCDNDDDYNSDWDFLDELAYWHWDSEISNVERIKTIRALRVKQDEIEKSKKSQYSLDQEQRVLNIIKDLTEKGIISPDDELELPETEEVTEPTTRYGRSPLHEAIAIRDIRLVKKYLKVGKYLDKVDNNGHTAMEMAYYNNYKEALVLFETYVERSKTG